MRSKLMIVDGGRNQRMRVSVVSKDFPPFTVDVAELGQISELKQQIFKKTQISPESQVVIHRGQVLSEEMSCSFYKIAKNDNVFLVLQKKSETRAPPSKAVERLEQILREMQLGSSDPVLLSQMNSILDDPTLTCYARVNQRARKVIAQCNERKCDRSSLSPKTAHFLAQTADLALDCIEGCSDGVKVQLLAEEKTSMLDPFPTTLGNSLSDPSEVPIPSCWDSYIDSKFPTDSRQKSLSERRQEFLSLLFTEDDSDENSEDCSSTAQESRQRLSQNYTQQVAILKSMGFADDSALLQALGETNGNVQMAARILQGRGFSPKQK